MYNLFWLSIKYECNIVIFLSCLIEMGITGLLPLLEKSSRRANIKEFAGETVAVDAYCWLHRGAFSCADKLVMNEKTLEYVNFCMKFINMLLSHRIKPILVFDGRHLPAKVDTEKKRRENRAINRKKGAELLRAGRVEEGRNYLRRSLDITHEMALNLIKECRRRNIDCIVAPHEADAQLAYLNMKDIAQVVITEDSDLLLFGCIKVLFKMDVNGNGILIEKDKLHVSMDMRHDSFTIDKFRYMCILSGCDYLPSLPGVGLKTALKFIHRMTDEDIHVALPKLPVYLDKRKLQVPSDYVTSFVEADKTFKYQLVYDPIRRRQIPLNEGENEDVFVGHKLSEDVAFQLAIGNLDPMSMRQMDTYDPDRERVQVTPKNKHFVTTHQSIWNSNYAPRTPKLRNSFFPVHRSTKGITVSTSCTFAVKRQVEVEENGELDLQSMKKSLLEKYSIDEETTKTSTTIGTEVKNDPEAVTSTSTADTPKSPILLKRKSVFSSLRSYSARKGSLIGTESSGLLISRYFSSATSQKECPDSNSCVLDLMDKVENNLASEETPTEEEIPRESPLPIVNKTSDDCANKDLTVGERVSDPFESIRRDLTKFVFTSQKRTDSESGDSLGAGSSSQIENMSSSSTGTTGTSQRDESGDVFDCHTPKSVLSPVNRFTSGRDSFYYKSEAETSPYFEKSADKVGVFAQRLPSSSPSPTKTPNRNVSLIKSTKKSQSSFGLRKLSSNQGKQQSLLTRFGFQHRFWKDLANVSPTHQRLASPVESSQDKLRISTESSQDKSEERPKLQTQTTQPS